MLLIGKFQKIMAKRRKDFNQRTISASYNSVFLLQDQEIAGPEYHFLPPAPILSELAHI